MISKNELKGKMVSYKDRDGKYRISKVYRISGKTLTVGLTMKINNKRMKLHWERIHPDKNTIFGAIIRKKTMEIEWNGGRTVQRQKISKQDTPKT
jgi:hypothetical protein